jgi:hypothetical protein
LLKIVIEEGKLSDRIVKLEDGEDEGKESSFFKNVVINLITTEEQQERDGDRSKNIH